MVPSRGLRCGGDHGILDTEGISLSARLIRTATDCAFCLIQTDRVRWHRHGIGTLIRDAQSLEPVVPSTLQAELRDYQTQGFQWAARLANWGAGACLADDMGLGKTVQALTVVLSRAPAGATLVVAPTSVCPSWINEARRFVPTLNPTQFGGGDTESGILRVHLNRYNCKLNPNSFNNRTFTNT